MKKRGRAGTDSCRVAHGLTRATTGQSSSWSGLARSGADALDRSGRKLLDQALPNDEGRLRLIQQDLGSKGRILLVVDQPATIGALPVAGAQVARLVVGYLPGLSMRRIADLHPGEAKTDTKDAFVIAEAARTMPHTLRAVKVAEEGKAELSMLCGFEDDLAQQATAVSNRIRVLEEKGFGAISAAKCLTA